MSLPHQSVAITDSIEFVNLTPTDVNPLVSKCDIKVFYLGKNRNQSFIDKPSALNMAKTLRGCPIVGYYSEDKEDFRDHGHQVTLDGDGIHFNCLTKPYGFVAPNSEVWFQDFKETDDFGAEVTRTYLMTQGYLWTGQYEEAKQVQTDGGKPQSMQLQDDDSLDGHWAEDNTGMEYFIINDAVISKLCILGDDVEPCFEGASVTEPDASRNFTLDNKNFTQTFFSMLKELKSICGQGDNMAEENKKFTEEEQNPPKDNSVELNSSENQSNTEGQTSETFADKKDDQDQNQQQKNDDNNGDEGNTDDGSASSSSDTKDDDDDKKKPATKNSLHTDEEYEELETNFNTLQTNYNNMKAQLDELVEFKNQVEDEKKDALIAKFYMLSDEDKKDVIDHKREYSLDQIEAKLAVIGLHKGVNFSLNNEDSESNVLNGAQVDVNNVGNDSTPDWVSAALEVEKDM